MCIDTLLKRNKLGIMANNYCSNYYTRDLHMKTPISSLTLIIHSVCDVIHMNVILREQTLKGKFSCINLN